MATRTKRPAAQQVSQEPLPNLKAAEFARLARQTGWRLAWLVCGSAQQVGQGKRVDLGTSAQVGDKLPLSQFAKLAGVSVRTVKYYYRAWQLAYEDGTAPCAAEDVPTDVEWSDGHIEPPDEFRLDDDDLAHPWSFYFDWAKTGQRPNPHRYEEDSEDESSTKPQLSVVEDETDESDSVDEDFGLPSEKSEESEDEDFGLPSEKSEESEESEESEDERIEADTEIQKDKLLSILESVRTLTERVTDTEVLGGNDEILVQIADAANELANTAKALSAKTEAA